MFSTTIRQCHIVIKTPVQKYAGVWAVDAALLHTIGYNIIILRWTLSCYELVLEYRVLSDFGAVLRYIARSLVHIEIWLVFKPGSFDY